MRLSALNHLIRLTSTAGFLLSVYSYIVELRLEQDSNYEAMCDISEHMKCTSVFSSEYAKGFGIVGKIFGAKSPLNQPNSIPGMAFYALCFLLSFSNKIERNQILIYMGILSNMTSVYLAYILYFVLRDFCVVCVSTYVVNATFLFLSIKRRSAIRFASIDTKKKKM